jgi:hypothetical protein
VFVVARVPLAFCRARGANARARFQHRAHETCVNVELPRKNAFRRAAHVRAILVQANAFSQRVDLLLAQAGVGARRARETALSAGLDAIEEVAIGRRTIRLRREHLFYRLHGVSPRFLESSMNQGEEQDACPRGHASVAKRRPLLDYFPKR